VFVLGSEDANHRVNEAYALGANSCLLKDSAEADLERLAEGLAAYAHSMPGMEYAACV
jgi:DNA-binding NarL/FixJ family response regulator